MNYIVNSLLDVDLYKLTMLRVFFSKFSNVSARYEFKCRNDDIVWPNLFEQKLEEEVYHLCQLQFTEDEIDYIGSIRYMKDAKGFLEFLRLFKLNEKYLHIRNSNGNLEIWAEGPIFIVSMFEIYILEIVNELYFRMTYFTEQLENKTMYEFNGHERLEQKIDMILNNPFVLTDFGTRRRYSRDWQRFVVKLMSEKLPKKLFVGTSNVLLAKDFNLTPSGTMAHEYLELGQALDNVTVACGQRYMLQCWADEYRGDLGTALTDNLGVDYFLKHDFDKYFSMLFTGVRHDSGDPIEWGNKVIEHYKSFGIDPMTKSLVFSDGLDVPRAIEIQKEFAGRAKVAFGIGTNLTNDVGLKPLNIVFKMVGANGKPVAKISDSPGKLMCKNTSYVEYLMETIDSELRKLN